MAKQVKAKLSVDDQLAGHIKTAEEALIAGVTLFTQHPEELSRETGYFTRLVTAQESVTALYRMELVRLRGPLRRRSGRR